MNRADAIDRSPDEERELVQAARARSPAAWAQLYDAYARRLYLYALARTGNREAAEDVTATVFLKALASIKSYQYKGRPFLAWLYGIARHVVGDHLRWQRRAAPKEALTLPPVDDGLASLLERIDLQAALAKLTREQREAILLHYFAGFSTAEIAALLGRKERAIYSLQARALAALRRHLAKAKGEKIPAPGRVISPSSADKP